MFGSGVPLSWQPAAFGLAGRRGTVVVTSADLNTLSVDELAAVLAHERTHLRVDTTWLSVPTGSWTGRSPACPSSPGPREGRAAGRAAGRRRRGPAGRPD